MAFTINSAQNVMGLPDLGYDQLPSYLSQAMIENQQTGFPNDTGMPASSFVPMQNWLNAPLQKAAGDSPVAQAMQDPQQTPTPVSQAMDGSQWNPSMISSAMTNPSAVQAMFDTQAMNPNMAMAHGLISAGAALGGAKDLGKGLAAAGQGFADGFDNTLNQQRSLNTPKVTPLGQDGAFSMVQLPGQQPQIMANQDVQDYVMGKVKAQKAFELANDVAKQRMEQQRAASKLDQTQGQQALPVLTNLQQSQAGIDAAKSLTDTLKTDTARAGYLKAYAALPTMAQRAAAAVGGGAMAQAAADYNTLNNAKIDGAKMEVAGLNGSLSNDEWTRAVGSVPSPSDAPAVWDAYYERAQPILKSRTDFYRDVVKRGSDAATREVNPYGPNQRPSIGIPQDPAAPQAHAAKPSTGTGNQPVQVSSFAEAAKLPSGTIFLDPNGHPRKVP